MLVHRTAEHSMQHGTCMRHPCHLLLTPLQIVGRIACARAASERCTSACRRMLLALQSTTATTRDHCIVTGGGSHGGSDPAVSQMEASGSARAAQRVYRRLGRILRLRHRSLRLCRSAAPFAMLCAAAQTLRDTAVVLHAPLPASVLCTKHMYKTCICMVATVLHQAMAMISAMGAMHHSASQ